MCRFLDSAKAAESSDAIIGLESFILEIEQRIQQNLKEMQKLQNLLQEAEQLLRRRNANSGLATIPCVAEASRLDETLVSKAVMTVALCEHYSSPSFQHDSRFSHTLSVSSSSLSYQKAASDQNQNAACRETLHLSNRPWRCHPVGVSVSRRDLLRRSLPRIEVTCGSSAKRNGC